MKQPKRLTPSLISWTPHPYQKKAVKFCLEHAAAALLLSPGLGKTSIVLSAIGILKKKKVLSKVLVIAPLRVCHSVWPKEVVKWKEFKGLRLAVLHGPNKGKILAANEHDIYLINPEGLDWLLDVTKTRTPSGKTRVSVDVRKFKALGFDTLVIDELTKFKHSNTNRFKSLKFVLATFQRRWGLTGSPAASGLMGLFGQFYMLDEGRSLGQYITQYRKEYFDQGYDGFTWTLKEGSEQRIYARVKPLSLRIGDEVLEDMPQLRENDIVVDLPPKVMKIYGSMEDNFLSLVEAGKITAKNAAVASGKLRQIANGGVYLTPEVEALVRLPSSTKEWIDLHECKLDALEELVEDLQGSPLLVAYDFGHDLARLQKRFGKDVPYIGGGVSAKRGLALETAWNAGELPLLLGHPGSISHGVNLQDAGHHVAWHSLTWSYEAYDQFLRRVLRQGNTAKIVHVHRIISAGTIDETMCHVLRHHESGQGAFFKALTSRR